LFKITRNWGKEKILKPRNNDESEGRDEREPKFSRICVCPSIPLCFTAFDLCRKDYYVYRTKEKVQVIYPWRLADKNITKEKWINKPTKFVRVGKINYDIIESLYYRIREVGVVFGGTRNDLRYQSGYKRFVLRKFREFGLGSRKMLKKCKAIIKNNTPKQKS